MESAVLWLGPSRPPRAWAHRLAASGLPLLEVDGWAAALPLLRAMSPGLVLVGPGVDPAPWLAALLEEGKPMPKLIAVVSTADEVVTALMGGALDALPLEANEEEVALRVSAWAREAELERRQGGAIMAVAERLRELEERLRKVEAERDRLRELAHRDELTGLGNRRSFMTQLEYALGWAGRYGGMVSAVLIDVDGLKQVNDAFGHAAGDAALRTVGRILSGSLRSVDHAARVGGDEFGLIMPNTRAEAAAHVAERLRGDVARVVLPGRLTISASFGVATGVAPRGVGFAADELLSRADAALYASKREGKNRVSIDEASRRAA